MVFYNIVEHKNYWAVKIANEVYDDPKKFQRDFPREIYALEKFSPEEGMDFTWDEMFSDMENDWGQEF